MSYVTYSEWAASPYAQDFLPDPTDDCALFASSGDVVAFLDYISSLIDLYAGRTFATGIVTETFRATNNQTSKFLSFLPLNEILEIKYQLYCNGYSKSASGLLTADEYMYFNDGKILFNGQLEYNAIYSITANVGYQVIPNPIKQATLMLSNAYLQAASAGAVATPDGGAVARFSFNKFEEGYTDSRQRYDNMNVGIPVTVYAILNKYKLLK